jgi:hypothetical protein
MHILDFGGWLAALWSSNEMHILDWDNLLVWKRFGGGYRITLVVG